jgi:hypothetical protein
MAAISDLLLDKELSSSNEVIEVILSLLLHSILLPGEPLLTSTSNVCDDQDTAEIVEEGNVLSGEFRLLAGSKATIGSQMGQNGLLGSIV